MIGTQNNNDNPVIDWLQSKSIENANLIEPDFDLIENRIIDSLQFVEFILFLEEATGQEISISNFSLDQIRTLNAIKENFFTGGKHGE